MKKIYLSGKVTHTTDYPFRFTQGAQLALKSFGESISILNPVELTKLVPADFPYACYMDICFGALRHCDVILMLNGYQDSKGAMAELAFAKCYGISQFYVHSDGSVRNFPPKE